MHLVSELEDCGDGSFQRNVFAVLAIDKRNGQRHNAGGSVGGAQKDRGAGPGGTGERRSRTVGVCQNGLPPCNHGLVMIDFEDSESRVCVGVESDGDATKEVG